MEGDLLRVFAICFMVETNRVSEPFEQSFLLAKVLFRYLLASRPTLTVSSAHQEWSRLTKVSSDSKLTVFFVQWIAEFCESFFLFSDFLGHTLKHVFDETAANPTGLKGPTRISESSFLGVMVRSVLVRWQSYEFDQQCRCYSVFSAFLGNLTQDEPVSLSPYIHVDQFEKFCAQGQMVDAESWVHTYFDNRNLNFLFVTNSPTKTENKDLAELALSLENDSTSDCEKRVDQRAMLALAVLRTRANDMNKAQLAVNEALKIAHQNGDHASVAYCLLLLFHIVERSYNSSSSKMDSEDLLRRCILRAASLKLPHLVAEAGLSYATFKQREAASMDGNQAKDSLGSSNTWSLDRIHRFLSICEYGDSQRISKALISDEYFSSSDAVSTMSGGMMSMRGPNLNMTTNNNDGSCLDSNAVGYASFSMKIAIVQAEVFSQQQEYDVAVLCCNRALERCSTSTDIDMQCLVSLHRMQMKVNAYLTSNPNCDKNEALLFFIAQLTQCKQQQESTKIMQAHGIFGKQVLGTIIAYLAALCAAVKSEWSRSLRFMDQCVAWCTDFASNHAHVMPILLQMQSLRCRLLQALIKGKMESLGELKIASQLSLLLGRYRCLEQVPLVQWLLKL